MFTIPCEAVFNQHPAVRRSALVGVASAGRAREEEPGRRRHITPILCVERVRGASIEDDRLTEDLLEIARSHEHTRAIVHVLYHPSFPMDVRHNAKIFREELAAWAAKKVVGP